MSFGDRPKVKHMKHIERVKLMNVEGGLELLRNAIQKGDPHRELELRARDLLREVRVLTHPGIVTQ